MDGITCALNKKCRESKSQEIVDSMNNDENAYEAIYEEINTSKDKE